MLMLTCSCEWICRRKLCLKDRDICSRYQNHTTHWALLDLRGPLEIGVPWCVNILSFSSMSLG